MGRACMSGWMIAGLLGCGGGSAAPVSATVDDDGAGGETAAASGESAAATLHGTVGGAPWEARTAVAGSSISGEADRAVALYPFVISCADLAEGRWPPEASEGMRDVSVTVTWTDGFTASPPDGSFERSRYASSDVGSVTVLRAGHQGRLRLEMQGEDAALDAIAGEIDVIDCGPSATVYRPRVDHGARLALAR